MKAGLREVLPAEVESCDSFVVEQMEAVLLVAAGRVDSGDTVDDLEMQPVQKQLADHQHSTGMVRPRKDSLGIELRAGAGGVVVGVADLMKHWVDS